MCIFGFALVELHPDRPPLFFAKRVKSTFTTKIAEFLDTVELPLRHQAVSLLFDSDGFAGGQTGGR